MHPWSYWYTIWIDCSKKYLLLPKKFLPVAYFFIMLPRELLAEAVRFLFNKSQCRHITQYVSVYIRKYMLIILLNVYTIIDVAQPLLSIWPSIEPMLCVVWLLSWSWLQRDHRTHSRSRVIFWHLFITISRNTALQRQIRKRQYLLLKKFICQFESVFLYSTAKGFGHT